MDLAVAICSVPCQKDLVVDHLHGSGSNRIRLYVRCWQKMCVVEGGLRGSQSVREPIVQNEIINNLIIIIALYFHVHNVKSTFIIIIIEMISNYYYSFTGAENIIIPYG